MKDRIVLGTGIAALVLFLSAMPAIATPFDLAAGGDFGAAGNIGLSASATKAGLTLTLTAITMTPDGDDNINPSTALTATFGGPETSSTGFYGTIELSSYGAGVNGWKWDDKKKTVIPEGSDGISGSGAHEDEALILTFSQAVNVSDFRIYFNGYDISGKDDDSAMIYIGSPVADPSLPILYTATIEANLVLVSGSLYYLDLSDSGLVWSVATPPTTFTQLIVRNDGGTGDEGKEFYVSGLNATISGPEPSTLLLIGLGLLGIAGIRKKLKN